VFGIGFYATGIAVADIDMDGWLDLVAANEESPFVSVLYGSGGGVFAPDVRLPTERYRTDVVVVDLDDDDCNDLVLTSLDGVSVFLGAGERTFAEEEFYPSYGSSQAIAAADFNKDGHSDVIKGGVTTYILLGNGDGTLAPPQQVGDADSALYLVTGDFNEDGSLDFAGRGALAGPMVWFGRGDGTFLDGNSMDVPGWDGVVHDFNGDDHLDLAVARQYTGIYVALGTGDGQFDPVVLYGGFEATHVGLGDLNEDGNQDLIGTNMREADIAVLLSNGDGTFQHAVTYPTPVTGGAVASGDFDRDGTIDVAFVSWVSNAAASPDKATYAPLSGVAMTLRGDGQGGLIGARVPSFGATMDTPEDIAAGDFNGDGHHDLAVANSGSAHVSIAVGEGDGRFAEVDPVAVGLSSVSLATGQFDAGPHQDLAVANRGSSEVSILLGNGDGSFTITAPVILDYAPVWVAQADFDEDTLEDLATANPDGGEVNILRAVGGGSFATPLALALGGQPESLAVADLDGQDGLDLAIAHGGEVGYISVVLGNGDGTFQTETRFASGTTRSKAIAAKDLDGDGYEDLVQVGLGDPPVVAFYGDGEGQMSAPVPLAVDARARDVAIADLDGDGHRDVAVTHMSIPVVTVLLGTESGFAPRMEYAAGNSGAVAVGEFNKDGRLDLAVTNQFDDRVEVLLNQAPTFVHFAGDKTTLSWPHLVGYDSFNVYRGVLADLVDSNDDGLPDQGYGACRNDLDPDLTDNIFVDGESPLPGAGFFYLMSRVRDGTETDLGTTSGGQSRDPLIPCGSSRFERTGIQQSHRLAVQTEEEP
jgi:hypothetical protein